MPGLVDFIVNNTASRCVCLAKMAQLAAQFTRNEQVGGSIPPLGFSKKKIFNKHPPPIHAAPRKASAAYQSN